MAVERFTPSPTYQQNELARIQSNLANAIDNRTSSDTILIDAGYYWNTNYTGGISPSTRTIYNTTNGTTNITSWFQFPVKTTVQGIAMFQNTTIGTRSDLYIQSNGQTVLTAQGIIAPNQLYGSVDGPLVIPADTQFNVAYSFPGTGLNLACYSYLLVSLGS
jgi:hypothetical protein